ncbi:MAG: hypothetical protein ACREEM_10150 [Blastocatellia bacterium]
MKIAVVTFDGFNEIDSFVAAHILNRVQLAGWKAEITAPAATVTSMNGVQVAAQRPLEFTREADAVVSEFLPEERVAGAAATSTD